VTFINRDQHPIIVTVLGSTDRFGETRSLIDWLYQHYQWLPAPP